MKKLKLTQDNIIIAAIVICALFIITGSMFGFNCQGYIECLNIYGWIAFIVPTVVVLIGFVIFMIIPVGKKIFKKE